MKRTLLLIIAGVVAGAFGYYAGIYVLLSLTGLEAPGWAPVAAVAGVGLISGLTLGLLAQLSIRTAVAIAVVGGALGAGIGFAVGEIGDSFEWAIASGLGLVVLLAAATRAIVVSGPQRSSSRDRELMT